MGIYIYMDGSGARVAALHRWLARDPSRILKFSAWIPGSLCVCVSMCVCVCVCVYTVESMGLYRLPTGMGSYDVGISYHNTDFKELALSLHDNNEKNHYSKTNLHLNKEGKCHYRIFFRNNTCLRSEILIFVNHYEVFDEYLGTPPQPYVVYPDESVYVGKPNSLEKPYLFEANYMWHENLG